MFWVDTLEDKFGKASWGKLYSFPIVAITNYYNLVLKMTQIYSATVLEARSLK